LSAKVLGIKIYTKKGCEGEVLTTARLTPDEGIVGNRHDDLCLLTTTAQEFMKKAEGLCFPRFKENLVVEGDLSDSGTLAIGDVVLELTGGKKFCFPECAYFSEDGGCPMTGGVAFARVVQGGVVTV